MGFGDRIPPVAPERQFLQEPRDIEHHIAFEWGVLQVTREAVDAYGITPLIPAEVKGPLKQELPRDYATGIGVNIVLLGPKEANTPTQETESGLMIGVDGASGTDTINIAVNFGENRLEALKTCLEALEVSSGDRESPGIYDAAMPADAGGVGGVPVVESYFHDLPQIYIGDLVHAVQGHVIDYADAILRQRESDELLRRQSLIGIIGAVGAGGAGIAGNILRGRLSKARLALIAGGSLLGSHLASRRALKRYMDDQPWIVEERDAMAYGLAQHVAASIHNIYCRVHFDKAMESALAETND